MKKIFLFLLLTIKLLLFSQQNGIIEYKYLYNPNIGKKPTNIIEYDAQSAVNTAFEYAKEHKYILKFNSNESLYYIESSLEKDNVAYPFALGLSKMIMGKGVFYQNAKEKYSLNQKESMHKLYLIKDTIENNWTISYEKKYIGGYKCYKATKKCKCGKDIVAWFTPEIPLPFGPAGYGGAPGLILEVSFFKHTLTMKKITLLKKRLQIQKPAEGEMITKKELDDLMWKKRMEILNKHRR